MSFWKHLPAIALGAALGAAAYFLTRSKGEQEHIVGSEAEVENTDSAETAGPETDAPAQPPVPETPAPEAEPAAAPEVAPAEPAQQTAPAAPAEDLPNINPVEQGPAQTPLTGDGKVDPTKIADPAIAGDWEETGCKG